MPHVCPRNPGPFRARCMKIVHIVGYRGSVLLFFGLLDVIFAGNLMCPLQPLTPAYQFINSVAPLWFWALLWGVTGLICLTLAWSKVDDLAFAAAISIKIAWGLLYVWGGLFSDVPRAWLSVTIWLAFAGFIAIISAWPEPDRQHSPPPRNPPPPAGG